jgi:hypothetical protein
MCRQNIILGVVIVVFLISIYFMGTDNLMKPVFIAIIAGLLVNWSLDSYKGKMYANDTDDFKTNLKLLGQKIQNMTLPEYSTPVSVTARELYTDNFFNDKINNTPEYKLLGELVNLNYTGDNSSNRFESMKQQLQQM